MIATCNATDRTSTHPFEVLVTEHSGSRRTRFRDRRLKRPVERELAVPNIALGNPSSGSIQFRRVVRASLLAHACTVAAFTLFLLVVVAVSGTRNTAAFAGLVGYLVGTLFTVLIAHHSIQNAAYQHRLPQGGKLRRE